ncbi:MAG: hypothetical protein LBE31_07030 [Deltaproteobacteria bacterium]|jgi:hypothetical protein|nr:hypothetical protein [Deltaproteobacteria bacterium]
MEEGKQPSEGIYLETKKSIIGTGSTAKAAEYRNFWVTLRIIEETVEMVLLDDSFSLTGIREKFPIEVLSGPNWLFVEQGEKKYRQLKPKLDSLLAPKPKPKPAAPKASSQSAFGGSKKAPAGSNQKKGWWSK